MESTENAQTAPIAERSKFIFISGIFGIAVGVILGFGLIVFGVLIYCLPADLADFDDFAPFALAAGGILAVYFIGVSVPQLIIGAMCPKALVTEHDGVFSCWCGKKLGMREIPAREIVSLTPASGVWYSNVIMLARGKYDASLTVATSDGQTYKIPCVHDVRTVASHMQTICARQTPADSQL